LIHEGGELTRGTWTGWDALVRGGLVWALSFISEHSLKVALIRLWLGALWLTNVLGLLSPALVFPLGGQQRLSQ
jgi:hypothetical protein